jgi:hypothetical protein
MSEYCICIRCDLLCTNMRREKAFSALLCVVQVGVGFRFPIGFESPIGWVFGHTLRYRGTKIKHSY